jgi:hypothetical protein
VFPPANAVNSAMEALRMVEMENRAKHRPSQLSGGQQQRTAIARALVNRPRLCSRTNRPATSIRTPASSSSSSFTASASEGRTIILVTHDPEIAAVTPRRIEIRDGRVAEQVDPTLAGLNRFPSRRGCRRMNLWNVISVGLKEIWAHKFRSMLTMLGIILGVSSLVAMSALVKGMEVGAREALIAIGGLQKSGSNPPKFPSNSVTLQDQAVGITINDVYALQYGAPLISPRLPRNAAHAAPPSRPAANRSGPGTASGSGPSPSR